jgi:hypothetical protein
MVGVSLLFVGRESMRRAKAIQRENEGVFCSGAS